MRNRLTYPNSYSTRGPRRGAFTLLEVLLALSLFMVLLAIVFIPLNQAFRVFQAGRTTIALQAAADSTVKQIAGELRGAIAVYPNSSIPGITNERPYSTTSSHVKPYFTVTTTTPASCTDGTVTPADNLSRIDFILPARQTSTGAVAVPIKAEKYLVSYYVRRFNAYLTPTTPFDPFSNPIGVFRAQTPYVNNADDATTSADDILYTGSERYGATCSPNKSKWLFQTKDAEDRPLEPLIGSYANDTTDGVPGSDTLISPRDMGVNTFHAVDSGGAKYLRPDLTFNSEDTDSNGIIDRVTISLTLIQYEEGSPGTPIGQRITATQVVNLSNTRLPV